MEDLGPVAGVLSIVVLIVAVAWIFLPFLVLSKLGELLKSNRELAKELKTANQWHARNDAHQERITQNTSALNPEIHA